MEGLFLLKSLLKKGYYYIAKLDLTEAYWSFPVSVRSQPYLRFRWKNTVFQFLSLPFKCLPYFYQNDETNYCSSSRTGFTANNIFRRYSPNRRELLNCEGEYTNNNRSPDLFKSASQPIEINFKTGSADRIFVHDYQFQNNGNFSSNFKTRQNHKAVQQTFENANYLHSGHLNTARSTRSSKTNNSERPTSLQRNSILPNRGVQNVPKLQPALHPKSQSYPGNSLVEVKGEWKPNFRFRPRHNHCHRCLHIS